MGEVWLARDEKLAVEVALKFIADSVRWDPASLDLLKQETNRSRQLSHPHIVRIHDFIEDAAHAAIVMEYLPGGSLHQARARQTPPLFAPGDILQWLPGVGAAIDYAHAQKIIHRDLKPGNLLIAADGAVKIADFGIAQPLLETSLRVSQWQPSGTLVYMSPQQHFGEPPRAADDIYALGATLYELLTGKPPFYSGNLAAQIERRQPDSLATRRRQLELPTGEITRAWEETIAACLAKRPEGRPGSATAIAAALTAPASPRVMGSFAYALAGRLRRRLASRSVLLGMLALTLGMVAWVNRPVARSGVAPVAAVFPSDATRAYAAWNFDGDGRDASGRGLDLRMTRAVPVEDRFGRIDRAVYLNGNTAIERENLPAAGWGGARPFTVALWIKPMAHAGYDATLCVLHTERQNDFFWELSLGQGRLLFMLGQTQVDHPDQIMAAQSVTEDRWYHIAATSDGQMLRLYLDGHQVAQGPLVRNRSAVLSAKPRMAVGFHQRLDGNRFAGAMDELRLWQRALGPDEIRQLGAASAPPRFVVTQGRYPDKEDLAAAVQREFGPDASLADWTEIKRWHADDTAGFCDTIGLSVTTGTFFVQRAGQRFSENPRLYFINRFDGKKPDYYKVHDELGGMTLALGSWYGSSLRALVELPYQPSLHATLQSESDGIVRYAFNNDQTVRAMSVTWRKELRRDGQGGPAEVGLKLRDGRELLAQCAALPSGVLALALGDAVRPEFTRQIAPTYDLLTFTAVVQPGRLTFRAVSRLGAEPLFQETVSIEGLKASDISSLRVSGVDAADLTVEK